MITTEGYGIPTASTPGNVGDYYIDLDTNLLYRCTNVKPVYRSTGFVKTSDYTVDSTEYTWSLCNLVNNQDKIVTSNGEYTRDDGSDGIGIMFVNIDGPDLAYGSASKKLDIDNTNTEFSPKVFNNSQYAQVSVVDVYASDEDKYEYYFDSGSTIGRSIVLDLNSNNTYTMAFDVIKYTVSTDKESSSTATVTFTVSDGYITAKSSSSAYCFLVSYRRVTPTVAIF